MVSGCERKLLFSLENLKIMIRVNKQHCLFLTVDNKTELLVWVCVCVKERRDCNRGKRRRQTDPKLKRAGIGSPHKASLVSVKATRWTTVGSWGIQPGCECK